jgi:N6-adenosine-specific RNA methylase IME4
MGTVARAHDIDDLIGISADVVLLDPPFRFRAWSAKGEGARAPQSHYQRSMTLDEIAALPMQKIAGPHCWVMCWIPLPHVPAVAKLFDAWRVKFSGPGLTWIKINKDGTIFKGGGYSFRANTEIAWLGRIGAPRRADKGVSSVIVARRGRHSAKPLQQYSRIECLAGPGKIFVELFARGSGPPAHWSAAGDELDLNATPMPAASEESTPFFDAERDVWRGVSEAYAEIRQRQAAGGPGWRPQ